MRHNTVFAIALPMLITLPTDLSKSESVATAPYPLVFQAPESSMGECFTCINKNNPVRHEFSCQWVVGAEWRPCTYVGGCTEELASQASTVSGPSAVDEALPIDDEECHFGADAMNNCSVHGSCSSPLSDIIAAIAGGRVDDIADVVSEHANDLVVNWNRKVVQVRDCTGQLAAQIPAPEHVLSRIATITANAIVTQ